MVTVKMDASTYLDSAYPYIKHLHVALVAVSGVLFLARTLGGLAGQTWPMWLVTRKCSVGIDVMLLCMGLTLWGLVHLNPLRDAWLGVKLTLLLAYIVVGSVAMRRGRTRLIRGLALCLAACLYASMVGVVVTHHPLDWGALWRKP